MANSERVTPDWAQLPDWANWWAVDACGIAWAYAEKPTISPSFDIWSVTCGKEEQLGYVTQYDCDYWKDTLACRYQEAA